MSYPGTTCPWQNLAEDFSALLASIPKFSTWAIHDDAVQRTTEFSAWAIQTCMIACFHIKS